MVEPAASGLPRWPVLLWFPALLAVLLIVFVALGISGSSTGALQQVFGSGTDPNLIAGTPRSVRSDEWLSFGSWLVSQATLGYPAANLVYPGGMDTTVLLDLPSWNWATIFRPNAFGFLFLGLDHGMAWRWWISAFAVMSAGYCMLITLLPRRPVTSAVVAVAFFFCPLLQWWYVPSTLLPAALGLLAITAVVASLRDPRRWVRVIWAVLTSYLAIATVLTFYPPYAIPAILVAAATAAGAFAMEAGKNGPLSVRQAAGRLLPLLIAAIAAGVVLVVFLLTRWNTIQAFLDTVYPGQRLQATGIVSYDGLIQILGAPFAQGLQASTYTGDLGPNSSEAATPVLIGLFLLLPLAWFVVRDWRVDHRRQWMMIACIAVTVVLFAFLFIPGWDPIAKLLLLDRTVTNRARMGLALLCIVAIGLLVRRLDERDAQVPWSVTWCAAGAAALSIIVVWVELAGDPALLGSANHRLIAVLFVLSVLLYSRGLALLGSIAFLIISLLVGVGVNPLYRGVVDLTQTAMGQDVERINDAAPGSWLGVGSFQLSSVLVESGVESFNGVQLYPSREMWNEVDPDGEYADIWNRYASIAWGPGSGEPQLSNPQADIIAGTFDSCSDFAQQHVTYVLADRPIEQSCLQEIDQASQGPSTYLFYEVVS
ncbi:MAG: hypothetical protein ABWZ98_17655 [Nakamurella sp.]